MSGTCHFARELLKIATNLYATGDTPPITRSGAAITAKSGATFRVKVPQTPAVKPANSLPSTKKVGITSGGKGMTKVVPTPKTVPNPLRGGTRMR